MAKFSDIVSSHPKVLVDFHATWCGPCKTLAPILSQVKTELGDGLKLIKIDIDKNQDLASKLNVRSVPTMIFFEDGKQKWRQSGVLPAQEILNKVR
jgi:thioredoxin 1